MINGGERVPVTMYQCWGKGRRVMVETWANWAAPQWLLRMGTGDVIPGMRALPAVLRDRPSALILIKLRILDLAVMESF
jgi:hypothetical protein